MFCALLCSTVCSIAERLKRQLSIQIIPKYSSLKLELAHCVLSAVLPVLLPLLIATV